MSIFTGGLSQGVLNYQKQAQDTEKEDADISYRKALLQQMQDQMQATKEDRATAQEASAAAKAKAQANLESSAIVYGGQGPQPPAPGQASVPMQQPTQQPPPQQMQPQPQGGMPPPIAPGMAGPPPQQRIPIPAYQTVAGAQRPPQQAQQQQMQPPSGMPQPQGQGALQAPGQLPTPQLSQVPQLISQMIAAPTAQQQAYQSLIQAGKTPAEAAQWIQDNQVWIKQSDTERTQKLALLTEAQKVGQDAFENTLKTRQQSDTEQQQKWQHDYQQGELGVSRERLNLDRQKASDTTGGAVGNSDPYKVAEKFGVSKAAFEKDADRFNLDGTLPSNTRNQKNMPYVTAIKNLAAERNPDANPGVNKQELAGLKATYSDAVKREAAVDRITGSIAKLQDRATELTNRLNGTLGGDWKNKTINELRSKFTDNADLKELDNLMYAVGRDYVAATTMPGSNAQMHITSGDKAESMANRNMTPGNLAGALKGINEDISASRQSLGDVKKRVDKDMHDLGSATSSSSSAAPKTVHWDDLK